MNCKKCGSSILEGQKYCPGCGQELTEVKTSTSEPEIMIQPEKSSEPEIMIQPEVNNEPKIMAQPEVNNVQNNNVSSVKPTYTQPVQQNNNQNKGGSTGLIIAIILLVVAGLVGGGVYYYFNVLKDNKIEEKEETKRSIVGYWVNSDETAVAMILEEADSKYITVVTKNGFMMDQYSINGSNIETDKATIPYSFNGSRLVLTIDNTKYEFNKTTEEKATKVGEKISKELFGSIPDGGYTGTGEVTEVKPGEGVTVTTPSNNNYAEKLVGNWSGSANSRLEFKKYSTGVYEITYVSSGTYVLDEATVDATTIKGTGHLPTLKYSFNGSKLVITNTETNKTETFTKK